MWQGSAQAKVVEKLGRIGVVLLVVRWGPGRERRRRTLRRPSHPGSPGWPWWGCGAVVVCLGLRVDVGVLQPIVSHAWSVW
eukprot:7873634-Pyramimonas_sp.AAC.1